MTREQVYYIYDKRADGPKALTCGPEILYNLVGQTM